MQRVGCERDRVLRDVAEIHYEYRVPRTCRCRNGYLRPEFDALYPRKIRSTRPERSANGAPSPASRRAAHVPAEDSLIAKSADRQRIEGEPEQRLGSRESGADNVGERVDVFDA